MASDRRSSSGLVTRGIIAVISAVVLVFLLVYMTNRETLNKRRGAGTETTDNAAGTVTIATNERQTEYGVQIGNNLKAFVADDTFFDGIGEAAEAPYTETDTKTVSMVIADENGDIVIRIVDDTDTLVDGALFSVSVARRIGNNTGGEMVYVDDDKDGVIRVNGLSSGRFEVKMKELDGYRVPQEVSLVITGGEDNESSSAGEVPRGVYS